MIPFLSVVCLVQPAPAPPLPPVPVLKQAKRLGLSPEQIKLLTEIQAKYAKELAERRKALVQSSLAFRNEVQAVLTPEQKAKAKKLRIQ